MLFLICQVGEDRYLVESSQIVEVVPLVQWKRIPHAPAGILGMFNFHGTVIPLVDLADLTRGTASPQRMSTRIIVVEAANPDSAKVLFGLVAEGVTETVRLAETDFDSGRCTVPQAPYLGAVSVRESRILQRIELAGLLPGRLRSEQGCRNMSPA